MPPFYFRFIVEHKNIPNAQLHEPKGVSSAASGTVYTADGSGSGSWTDSLAALNNRNLLVLQDTITDLSTPGSATSCAVFPVPKAGKVIGIAVTARETFTTANNVITAQRLTAGTSFGSGTAMNGGGAIVTLSHSQGAFYSKSGTVTANNSVSVGDCIVVASDGGGTGVTKGLIVVLLDVSS